jgi:hypothetical protein
MQYRVRRRNLMCENCSMKEPAIMQNQVVPDGCVGVGPTELVRTHPIRVEESGVTCQNLISFVPPIWTYFLRHSRRHAKAANWSGQRQCHRSLLPLWLIPTQTEDDLRRQSYDNELPLHFVWSTDLDTCQTGWSLDHDVEVTISGAPGLFSAEAPPSFRAETSCLNVSDSELKTTCCSIEEKNCTAVRRE